ncbi:bifunctional YncE family protein/alkaline phosphatase family protein [Maribellus maritimus]|uniref:bifunctional YncE family protein/alkaline phosphatase family protein n=1 Tax=Maribellus maritimus TaxID=2870838 RepID=UPI001EEC4291|nr:bifunctional YncE family protein/alkaline phosphatase family protein [Maribellus maritimus]MCG6187967.1 bifunctional YncE family protein/alkaline phosphatase family protein [Maribellus maritimus]
MHRFIFTLVFPLFFLFSCTNDKNPDPWITSAPAGDRFVEINNTGETVIPNGRLLTPVGKSIVVAPHPFGLTISPDGNTAVTANSGTSPLSITIIRNILSENPEVQQIPPGPATDRGVLASVFMGLAVSKDNSVVYVAGGQENKIFIFDLNTGKKKGFIDCSFESDSIDYTHGYIGDLTLSKNGKKLFAVDQIGFRMIIANTETNQLEQNIPVGRYPFGICLSPDEKKVYVANVGMFQYSMVKGITSDNVEEKALKYPPFAYGSKEMIEGIQTDSLEVPGLGEMNSSEGFSVFTVSLEDLQKPEVIAKTKTGHLVGAMVEDIPAVGGASPNSLVATDDYVFVTNGTNDNISVISIEQDTVVQTIYLKPDKRIKQFRGVIPFGLALSPDNQKLFVACSGINAVAVVDTKELEVLGYIPTGWFPAKLKVSNDGKQLIVANAKGFGSGPNGGSTFNRGPEGSYIGALMKGTVQVLDIPSNEALRSLTEKVISNNFNFERASSDKFAERKNNPVPLYPGEKESPIKHIVFISKENRTYDEIFGQIKKGKGEPQLARYGTGVSFANSEQTASVENADVMVNHLKIAKDFAISDNFYVDSDVSADGHRWLVNTYPNEWTETCTAASYGGNRRFKFESKAPGVYAMNGAAGAIYPEDYNEAGSMWDHLERNKIDFYNFGFSIMFEPSIYEAQYKYQGNRHYINYPLPQPIWDRTSKQYPTYNMAIPDQFRIDQFQKEFNHRWIAGKDTMPALMTVIIPNDHGAGDRPEAGYPFRESYMADNDLAVGRIVEFLSHTPYWKNMLIVITEDDAQNGVDHVDAHRSILMLISPWVKKDYVSHFHYSFGSIFKTFWNILGLPYLNQYDAGANDMSDFFTDSPDYTPYNAIPVDSRIFEPQKALDPFDENFDWKALEESPVMDDKEDMIQESKERDEYRLENREKEN